jgi:hypothetical protein
MAIAIDMGLRITSRRFACCCGKALTPLAIHADRGLIYVDCRGFLKA